MQLTAVYAGGIPSTAAPHNWIQMSGRQLSTLDLCGPDFTLLAAAEARAWCDACRTAAAGLGVALDVHRIGVEGLVDPSGEFAASYGLAPSGCVLVRPDGVVAWRAVDDDAADEAVIGRHLRAILDRD
jgi:hypothetical protein